MAKPKVRSPYNYDRDAVSVATGLLCLDPTLTQQHQKDEADINVIVKRFGITGTLPAHSAIPLNVDFEDIFDYHSAMTALRQAQESFDALPSAIRARFKNDPGEFVDFASDPANLPELRKLGLALNRVSDPAPAAPAAGDVSGAPKPA